ILEIARSSLESLDYWPLPEEPAAQADMQADAAVHDRAAPVAATTAANRADAAPTSGPVAPATPPPMADPGRVDAGLGWESVQAATPTGFDPVEDEYPQIPAMELSLEEPAPTALEPAGFESLQREALEPPSMEIAPLEITPAAPDIAAHSERQRLRSAPASGEDTAAAAHPGPAAGDSLDRVGLGYGADAHAGTDAPAPGTFSFAMAPSAPDSAGNLPVGLSLEPAFEPSF